MFYPRGKIQNHPLELVARRYYTAHVPVTLQIPEVLCSIWRQVFFNEYRRWDRDFVQVNFWSHCEFEFDTPGFSASRGILQGAFATSPEWRLHIITLKLSENFSFHGRETLNYTGCYKVQREVSPHA